LIVRAGSTPVARASRGSWGIADNYPAAQKLRKAGIEQALALIAASTTPDERWWVGAALLEAL